jgi:hypothetical protein
VKRDVFENLTPGDIIKQKTTGQSYFVTENTGSIVIGVATIHGSAPADFDLVAKGKFNHVITEG